MIIEAEGLLGREEELAVVGRFVATLQHGPAALVLEGEPGIGKTVLFEHALDCVRSRGDRILVARPTSAERSLSFVGLTDLLSEARDVIDELPAPQRRALEVALLLDDSPNRPPDPRAIGMGLLGILRALAASRAVVVAVDDLQWLDAASTAALSFALRRVTDEPIGLLAASRSDAGSAAAWLDRSMRGEHLALGPLSVGAIHALLTERHELSIPRSLLLRIHEACRGNPLFALEIGRALGERGLPEPGRLFEIPADAEALFAARLRQLPEDTLDALAVAAAIAAPTRSLVRAVSEGALEPALRAGIVRLEGERVHFTHPLLASAVYTRLDPVAQRALHRRIATAVRNLEERARHLALAADEPDGDVAAALDEAVEQADRRGARAAAAELAELAVKLTPECDVGGLRTRQSVAARRHFLAGDAIRSRTILERLLEELAPGPERARALLQLADTHSGVQVKMLPLREEAAVEAIGDDRVLTFALRELARTLFVSGQPVQGLARAREALAAAERTGDVRFLAASLAYVAFLEIWNGRVTPGILERAGALEEEAGYLRMYESAATVDGLRLMVLEDDLDSARVRLTRAEQIARDHDDEDARAILLNHLAELEFRAGRFADAARYATEALDLREQFGFGIGASLCFVALVDALRGRHEAARAAAERALASCERAGYEIFSVRNLRVLGLLALSTGDSSTATRILAPLPERLAARGYGLVNILQVLPDAIEAMVAAGDLDRAAAKLEQLDEVARTLGSAYARARFARCHGLLACAERDYGAALDAFESALREHERLPDPLERGRTLLALGQTQRRAAHRRHAREALQKALAIFEELGALPWADQARTELGRLGGRAPSARALTGAEERVARLVAEGNTNREVAAALFVTERTVETHLSSIYRKLDVRSRSELARHLAEAAAARTS